MATPLSPGVTVDRYHVDAEVGAGSMGDVFRATDVELGRKVAVKILSDRHRDNEELRARFVREARAVAAISHPNVVQVFTTGSFDGRPYIAMEFLDGVDLGTEVNEGGPWSSLQAARAVLDAARGLDAAAKAGLIHRDVKPSNLVMLRDGRVKVTDFGLAKPLDPGDEPALTAMGVVVGTPDYIAPEQARGDPIDERVDIYALGGTLYYLLTGVPPFRTGKKAEDKYLKVVARHLRQAPPDPRKRNAAVDAELAELTMKLMAKKPVQRPGYDELIEQLVALIDRLQRAGSGPITRPPTEGGAGGKIAPTPFVGGAGPRRNDFEQGATHNLDSDGVPAASFDEDDMESAPTTLRMPTVPPVAPPAGTTDDLAIVRPKPARWLIVITVLAVLVFLTGLGLLLFGPMPSPEEASAKPATAPPADAAPTATDSTTALEPPPGMLLVRKPDGSPWLFVAARPVSWTEYRAVFPRHKKPSQAAGDDPVTDVGFAYAQSYAETRRMRLPTAEEWAAALATEGFEPAGKRYWEWVAPPKGDGAVDDAPAGDERPVRSTSKAKPEGRRSPDGHDDVTFRLVRDL